LVRLFFQQLVGTFVGLTYPRLVCLRLQPYTVHHVNSTLHPSWVAKGKKGKAKHLYSALHGIQTTLKHSGMDHTCKEHHASLYLVSVHQMAPPLNLVEVGLVG